jgi:hypothetical protein
LAVSSAACKAPAYLALRFDVVSRNTTRSHNPGLCCALHCAGLNRFPCNFAAGDWDREGRFDHFYLDFF